jgi:hypothetical protein
MMAVGRTGPDRSLDRDPGDSSQIQLCMPFGEPSGAFASRGLHEEASGSSHLLTSGDLWAIPYAK